MLGAFISINKLNLLQDPATLGLGTFNLRQHSGFRPGRPELDSLSSNNEFIRHMLLSNYLSLKLSCSFLDNWIIIVFNLQIVIMR